MIGWIPGRHDKDNKGDVVYALADAKDRHETREILPGQLWLVLRRAPNNDTWIYFAFLEFYSSKIDDTEILCTCLFHGAGATGLRECRHVYFGEEDGYLFYPNGKYITAAFNALSEFFDDMK